MDKKLVIYSSKYGHTKKYAEWLAEELQADICDIKNILPVQNYSTIIFGSSLYAGRNKVATLIVKYFEQLKDKKVVLFTVGILNPNSETNLVETNKELDKVLSPEIREKVKIFHIRGGIDSSKLSISHKIMMKFVQSIVSKKAENERNDSERDFLAVYGKTIDFSDKKMLEPVIRYLENDKT
jgi:menaquinone-dependent protoporphyrinogen IX oxidase